MGNKGVAGEELGNIIKGWREDSKLSRADVAFVSGESQEYIGKIERGEIHDPGLLRVGQIVKALGHTLDELYKRCMDALRAEAEEEIPTSVAAAFGGIEGWPEGMRKVLQTLVEMNREVRGEQEEGSFGRRDAASE